MQTIESSWLRRLWLPALVVGLSLVALSGTGLAQSTDGGPRDGAAAPQAPPVAKAPAPRTFDRWIELQGANFIGRFGYVDTSTGHVSARVLQDGAAIKARVTLDPAGRFSLNAGVATGPAFTSAFNNTGVGTGDAVNTWFLKQLFVAATPVTGFEVSYGGLAFVRGESTEITTYDNDAYLVGQRVRVRKPKTLYVDELTATFGFLGDLNKPNVMRRYRHLADVNYREVLASKQVAPWLAASSGYTRVSGVSTIRAAVAVKTPRARIVDLVRYEQYARRGAASACGFAATVQKTPVTRLTVGAGFADIDLRFGGLNGDRFNKGRRVFGSSTVTLTSELAASVFAGRAIHNDAPIANRTRIDVILTYNALAALKRTGLLR